MGKLQILCRTLEISRNCRCSRQRFIGVCLVEWRRVFSILQAQFTASQGHISIAKQRENSRELPIPNRPRLVVDVASLPPVPQGCSGPTQHRNVFFWSAIRLIDQLPSRIERNGRELTMRKSVVELRLVRHNKLSTGTTESGIDVPLVLCPHTFDCKWNCLLERCANKKRCMPTRTWA